MMATLPTLGEAERQKEAIMSDKPETPAISVETLTEALRQAFNPAIGDRMQQGVRQPPPPEQRVACVAPSGAHFDAVIVPSRTYPGGRVVNLDNFRYPPDPHLLDAGYPCHEGPETFEWPRGLEIVVPSGEFKGNLTLDAKRHLDQTIYPEDLRRYVGGPLDPFIRADRQADLKRIRDAQAKEHAKFMAEQTAATEAK